MKTSFALIAAGAAFVAAQTQLSDLPACGQTCINNMLQIAQTQFGCANGNVTCYCTEPRFGYGVRDCADQACPSNTDATQVISFGSAYCSSALAAVASSNGGQTPTPNAATILAGATGAGASSGSGSASSTATVTSTVSSGAEGATGAAGAAGIVAVDGGSSGYAFGSTTITAGGPGVTVSNTDYSALPSAEGVVASMISGSMITTISGSSALGAVAGIGGAAASATGSAGSAMSSGESAASSGASSVNSEASSMISSVESGASSSVASIKSSASAGASSATSKAASVTSSSSGGGVMQTAAPALFGAAAFALLAL